MIKKILGLLLLSATCFGYTVQYPIISTSSLQSGATFYVSSGTAVNLTATNINTQLARYRRPALVYTNGWTIFADTSTMVNSAIPIVFPDGAVYSESNATLYTSSMNVTASWGNAPTGGIRPTETRTANAWYSFYVVKSTLTTNTTDYVLVASSISNIPQNLSNLNTAFGANGWAYLGTLAFGQNAGGSTTTNFVSFVQSGDIVFFNAACAGNASTSNGILLASAAGATSLTWTYASGNLVSGSQVPANIQQGWIAWSQAASAVRYLLTDSAGAIQYLSGTGTATYAPTNTAFVDLTLGAKSNPNSSIAQDIFLYGYVDKSLGVGANPQQ